MPARCRQGASHDPHGADFAAARPGPVLHIWRDGQEVARLPLDLHGALALVEALLRETRAEDRAGRERPPPLTPLASRPRAKYPTR
jgi:hypothetical protein